MTGDDGEDDEVTKRRVFCHPHGESPHYEIIRDCEYSEIDIRGCCNGPPLAAVGLYHDMSGNHRRDGGDDYDDTIRSDNYVHVAELCWYRPSRAQVVSGSLATPLPTVGQDLRQPQGSRAEYHELSDNLGLQWALQVPAPKIRRSDPPRRQASSTSLPPILLSFSPVQQVIRRSLEAREPVTSPVTAL
jgi:hypothetical protein